MARSPKGKVEGLEPEEILQHVQAPNDGQQVPYEERILEREDKLDNLDRENIDTIIKSGDVQKGGKIRIERKAPAGRDYQWIETMSADQWKSTDEMYEYLRKAYGGGEYRCMTSRANGRNYRQFSLTIDSRYKGALDEDEIARLAAKAAAGNSKDSDAMVRLVQEMKTSSGGMQSSDMIKLMEMGNHRSEQMMGLIMAMMTKSQESMATIMAAVISAKSNGNQTTIDPVIVELLKSKQERPPIMEILDTMRAIKELNQDDREEPQEESMWEKILKVAQVAIPALSPGVAPPAGAPAAPPVGQPQPQPQLTGGIVDKLPLSLKIGISGIIKAAERNADVGLYADLILDQVQEEKHRNVLNAILTDGAWVLKLFGDEKRVAHVRPWLEELRQILLNPNDTDSGTNPNSDPGAGPPSPP